MTRLTLILLPLLFSFINPANAAEPKLPKDGEYTFKITHVADHPEVSFPHSPIPNKAYKPVKEEKTLIVRFTKKSKEVLILPGGVAGTLEKADANGQVYKLSKGLFAGGSFTLNHTKKGLIATYTKFGSGVPVISSVRGSVRQPDKKAEQDGAGQPATRPESK
jgi:hypothetical protein